MKLAKADLCLAQFSVSHDSDSIEAFFARSAEPYGMPMPPLLKLCVIIVMYSRFFLTEAGNYEAVSP